MNRNDTVDVADRTRMPADVDAPDKVAYGLTWRQLAILAVAGMLFYGAWNALRTVVPPQVIVVVGAVLGAALFGLVVGRRDGLPLDVWLVHAIRHLRSPKGLSPAGEPTAGVPDWVQPPKGRTPWPAPLRLPADAIDADGEITVGGDRAAIVAATNINLTLRTGSEQAALIEGFGRWLNSLSTPTQVLVSAQPVDLVPRPHGRRRRPQPAAPSPAGGVRGPCRVPGRPGGTPGSAAPPGPRGHPHRTRRTGQPRGAAAGRRRRPGVVRPRRDRPHARRAGSHGGARRRRRPLPAATPRRPGRPDAVITMTATPAGPERRSL